jgi:alpha-tubulin suppressor-like RCC1 family protein
LSLDSEGHVWAFGSNSKGQLGFSDLISRKTPERIENLPVISMISCGYWHSLVLDENGNIWGFGHNDNGQLGTAITQDSGVPTMIESSSKFIQISSGFHHNLALDNLGCAWSFGYNNSGQLGVGDKVDRYVPTKIAEVENVIQIICGGKSSFVVDIDHRIFGFGDNEDKPIINAFGDTEPVTTSHTSVPKEIPSWKNMTIIAGGYHVLVIDQQGELFYYGKLEGHDSTLLSHGKQGLIVQRKRPAIKNARTTTF